jgi:hypothetical protein
VGAAVGRATIGCGVGRTATTIPPLGCGSGSSEGDVLADGGTDEGDIGEDDEVEMVEDGEGAATPGWRVPAEFEGTAATSPGAWRGAPIPTARAKVARTRLRTPSATTSRARWADVTSLSLSFRRAIVGQSVLSRMLGW